MRLFNACPATQLTLTRYLDEEDRVYQDSGRLAPVYSSLSAVADTGDEDNFK